MTELMRILYDYALERQMDHYLDDLTQYHESDVITDQQYAGLQKLLDEAGRQQLENYTDDLRAKHSMELEAMFHAGLSLGQKLAHL